MRRVAVISHPNVVPPNQLVYLRLAELGWTVDLIVPNRWRDDYVPEGYTPEVLPGFRGTFSRVRVARPGAIQRHVYVTRPTRWLRRLAPDAVFLEQEPYAIPTVQWGQACERLGIPWGTQGDDNIDRPLPAPARIIRSWTMPRIDFFAARSPAAVRILEQWGARGPVGVVPHTLPEWKPGARLANRPFTVGFAGRLVPAKGIADLLAAVKRLPFDFRLLVVGDGPLRDDVDGADLGRGRLERRAGVRSVQMPSAYAEMDVLVLPSRTTATWAEQFGRVLGEALLCGTPVVGSSSGEIPWVIETAQGGLVFPEGDVEALAGALIRLHDEPGLRGELAQRGREGVERHLSARGAAAELDRLLGLALRRRP